MSVKQIKHSTSPYRALAGSLTLGSQGGQGRNRTMLARILVAVSCAAIGAVASPTPQDATAETDVLKAEEVFRLAKLNNDV